MILFQILLGVPLVFSSLGKHAQLFWDLVSKPVNIFLLCTFSSSLAFYLFFVTKTRHSIPQIDCIKKSELSLLSWSQLHLC